MRRFWSLLVVAVLAAACSGGAGATATPAAAATVKTATTSLGTVLVGTNGKTLYAFTPDQTAGKPTCNEGCVATWPPLTVTGDFTVASGLDKAKFKLVARDDGSMQLQVGDYPLYFYGPDVNAGDVNGQGVGGKWFVVGQDGALIGASG